MFERLRVFKRLRELESQLGKHPMEEYGHGVPAHTESVEQRIFDLESAVEDIDVDDHDRQLSAMERDLTDLDNRVTDLENDDE